ncbi:MAG TPA: hypothetical protein VMI31_00295 [Fimbriimonadaceae bacterium]|nr:hypothetical protein [Fimbriimonadaceae bacterium]
MGQYVYFEFTNSYRKVVSIPNATTVVLDSSVGTLTNEVVACWGPLYYGSAVLADGRVVIVGGEYSFSGNSHDICWSNQGAIYDPVANTWSPLPAPAGWTQIGDAESCVLPDGRWALADPFNTNMAILNPATLTWSSTGAGKADGFDEEGWTLLPEGSVLTVDSSNGTHGEKYLPSVGSWISAADAPQGLFDLSIQETGPMVLMPNGKVFAAGGLSHTAVYTPGLIPVDTGSWVSGPEFPTTTINGSTYQLVMTDAPGCLLPNGNVLLCTSPNFDTSPAGLSFFEFDGANLNSEPATPDSATRWSFNGVFLMLPNGQAMFTDQTGDIELYTMTSGSALDAWRPTITSCPTTLAPGMSFILQGTQLNGLSQCSAYGDDVQNATNYPIVRIRNTATGHIRYARTHDHSTMAVATGSANVWTHVDLPAGLETGPATLTLIANGITSSTRAVTVASKIVQGTVTLQNYSASPNLEPVTIEIRNVGSTTPIDSQVVTLDASGNFQMATAVATGTYDITAKGPHWLRQKLSSQTIGANGILGLHFSLVNGDINGDNAISLADFGKLKLAYGSVPGNSNWNPNADLDGNGSVGLSDFGILKLHYGQTGAP